MLVALRSTLAKGSFLALCELLVKMEHNWADCYAARCYVTIPNGEKGAQW